MKSRAQTVNAKFASYGATTHTIYLDNESRSVLLKIDESEKQTKEIIACQHSIDHLLKREAEMELANLIRVLKPVEVINPFAEKIVLPSSAKMLRRLNKQFLDFVSQVTFLHQYQRKVDDQNRVITTKEDVKLSIELFFDSIWLKIDELDSPLRSFFEKLKGYVETQSDKQTYNFTQREIRQSINVSSAGIKRFFRALLSLEYISIVGGSSHVGFQYSIQYWDDINNMRTGIKTELINQLKDQ
jgi:hypothetical protein